MLRGIQPRLSSPTFQLGVLQTLLWLSLLQALRALFSALFGVVYDAVFAETLGVGFLLIAGAGLLLAFLSPLIGGRLGPRGAAMATLIAMAARIPVGLDLPPLQLWASLLTVGAAFAALAAFLRRSARCTLGSLALALLLDQLLRAAGTTWDLSLRPGWWPIQALLVAICFWLARGQLVSDGLPDGGRLTLGGSFALSGLLFLQLNLLGLPNALARWSGTSYAWLAPALLAVSLAGIWLAQSLRPDRGHRALLAALLVAGLVAGHLAPAELGAAGLLLSGAASMAMLGVLPRPAAGQRTGLGLALGNLVFLVLSFGLAFAFTYPYTLPALRGSGVAWYLAAALLSGLAVPGEGLPVLRWPWRRWGVAVGLVGVLLVAWLARLGRVPDPPAGATRLRLATYNMHYGYDELWHLSPARQAETLAAMEADVVALQEVDTGRMTSYSIDDALWLGRRLGMHVVYLPTVEHLTGIALLSRYPVVETEMTLLPSREEQTGLIHARLQVGGERVDVFATWLGLNEAERARQVAAALTWLAERSPQGPACFAGDLNSLPESPTYRRLAGAGFGDPFRALGLGDVPTDPALVPRGRIDYVWLRALTPVAAGVPSSLASDHRPVWVEVKVP